MNVRTYVAPNVQEATKRAVEELGRDAVILKIKPAESKGLWRVRGRQQVELQACAASELPVPPKRRPPPADPEPEAPLEPARGRLTRAYVPTPRPAAGPDLRDELKTLSERVERMAQALESRPAAPGRADAPEVHENLQQLYRHLLDHQVAEPAARGLVLQVNEALRGEEIRNPVLARVKLKEFLERAIRFAGPIETGGGRARVVALVGPTGVGKTTTIAKLATHFRWKRKLRVGLATIDAYRMGAREQLQQYADILGCPCHYALTPQELRRALVDMADRDLILVDTAGYSQKDLLKLNEIRAFLTAAKPDEVHLVISTTSDPRVSRHVVEMYRSLQVNRILLTKLDEALGFGSVLDLMASCEHPLSYATEGQDVTEEIGLAEPARIARLILGEETA